MVDRTRGNDFGKQYFGRQVLEKDSPDYKELQELYSIPVGKRTAEDWRKIKLCERSLYNNHTKESEALTKMFEHVLFRLCGNNKLPKMKTQNEFIRILSPKEVIEWNKLTENPSDFQSIITFIVNHKIPVYFLTSQNGDFVSVEEFSKNPDLSRINCGGCCSKYSIERFRKFNTIDERNKFIRGETYNTYDTPWDKKGTVVEFVFKPIVVEYKKEIAEKFIEDQNGSTEFINSLKEMLNKIEPTNKYQTELRDLFIETCEEEIDMIKNNKTKIE